MSKYLLSIIIPVYNVEKYLQECIDSFSNQISNKCEVILIDDGSTDSSGLLCDKICQEFPSFRVIHKQNGGLSDARNVGIQNSKGEYILFLDSDDKLASNIIPIIEGYIEKYGTDIFLGRTKVFSEKESNIGTNINSYKGYQHIQDPSKLFIELDKNSSFWFAAWLIIIKRSFIENNDLYFEKGILHEDERWVPLVFAQANSVFVFDDIFYLYRTNREGSIVSAYNIKREFDKISTAIYLCDYPYSKKSSYVLLRRRAAALMFGSVLSLGYYQNHNEFPILLNTIKSNLNILFWGKYRLVYVLCKIFGIVNTSKLLNKKL